MDLVMNILSLYLCVDKPVTLCLIKVQFLFVCFLGMAEVPIR